ncbi:MAG TPA: dihydrodipicolinate synthase family protein [Acidimicrobiales bacterium]|nr:dihydrodipicolinate synthase family protein [Acidimicrobiales bacterium]
MPRQAIFNGIGVALVTLFRPDGELDAPATADLATQLVELGARAVVVAGTTGEAAALEHDERSELVAAVRAALPQSCGVPLVAGVGAPSARQASRFTRAAINLGADAVLALSPPRTDDPLSYYQEVAVAADGIPVIGYHYPAVSPPGISLEALAELPVAALKDSSADAGRLLATLDSWDRPVYVGSSALITLGATLGCAGAILALANAEPEVCQAAFAGDAGAQLKLAKFRPAEARFPHGLKELVAARFGCSPTARLG